MCEMISGGVCAAQGFRAAGLHVGVKTHNVNKKDVALIVSDAPCAAAAMFTKNVVQAAPIHVTRAHLAAGRVRAVIANSGNANACAPHGEENAERMCAAAASALGCAPEEVLVASTGVIGQTLKVDVIEKGVPELFGLLERSDEASDAAAHAIMTTDTVKKECAGEVIIGGKTVRIGGIAKGSGMIHPNMGTMLCFLTTDCAISQEMLQEALREVVRLTFNRISVDGDTSTNDTCVILANGMAGNPLIEWKDEGYAAFKEALDHVCRQLARSIAGDGEGAGKLVTCRITGARSEESAERLAKAVVGSSLVKAAMCGADANWGRVLAAMGYSKAPFRPEHVDISFSSAAGEIMVCGQGDGLPFDEARAKEILSQKEVVIAVDLHEGEDEAECWGCDLTAEYVHINGDYRS